MPFLYWVLIIVLCVASLIFAFAAGREATKGNKNTEAVALILSVFAFLSCATLLYVGAEGRIQRTPSSPAYQLVQSTSYRVLADIPYEGGAGSRLVVVVDERTQNHFVLHVQRGRVPPPRFTFLRNRPVEIVSTTPTAIAGNDRTTEE